MPEKIESFLLKRIITETKIPSLSPLVIQLIEVASDEKSSAKELAQIVEKDPGLTTRLIKLANSAFFGLREKVTTISRAIVILGFSRVRLMALTLSLRETFPLEKVGNMDYGKFWKTSLYRASIARTLAKKVKYKPEEAFINGLILEIGLLLLFATLTEKEKENFPGNTIPLKDLLAWEEKHFGINHRQIGEAAFKAWKFPEEVSQCQKYPLSDEAPLVCKIVQLADWAVEMFWGKKEISSAWYEAVETTLGISAEGLNKAVCEAFKAVDVLAQELKINIDKEKDLIEIMERANRAMSKINLELEQKLQKAILQMEQVQEKAHEESVQATLDAVAHEIRNPLMALGGFARRLSQVGADYAKVKTYAQVIVNEASRLERVLKDIGNYCQFYVPRLSLIDIKDFLNEIIKAWEEIFKEHGIEISQILPQEKIILSLDKLAMTQVVNKLIENALNSTPSEGGKIIFSIEKLPGRVILSIADNGQGYDEETIALITQETVTNKSFKPGLGIPWIKKIVKAHKGELRFESKKGEGTKVYIYLPYSENKDIIPSDLDLPLTASL